MKALQWTLAAALAAYAAHLSVLYETPIDRALPLIAVAVTLCAAASYPSVMLGLPLLLLASQTMTSEPIRLASYGAICAAAMAIALAHRERNAVILTIVPIVLLRWIPLEQVRIGRELFLIAIAIAIAFVLRRTPLAIVVAVGAAFVTPAIPLRTLAVPLLVLIVAIAARAFGMPRIEAVWPSAIAMSYALLFFAWSGIVARAVPYFFHKPRPALLRQQVQVALAPRRSLTLAVPEGAQSLVVSGANVAHLRRGAILGTIAPGNIRVRIGDAADWGGLRREVYFRTRNPLPRDPAGGVRGYGYEAWVDGPGRVPLPPGARTIVVTGDASLPANASLQVEGFE
ncbi:MAG: hypothetical protein M3Q69_09380 [Acidobacteriota bacterium]|nr:hypothetical protein [Acidobacteriota bacterium]